MELVSAYIEKGNRPFLWDGTIPHGSHVCIASNEFGHVRNYTGVYAYDLVYEDGSKAIVLEFDNEYAMFVSLKDIVGVAVVE